jgi:hypothetical protein
MSSAIGPGFKNPCKLNLNNKRTKSSGKNVSNAKCAATISTLSLNKIGSWESVRKLKKISEANQKCSRSFRFYL